MELDPRPLFFDICFFTFPGFEKTAGHHKRNRCITQTAKPIPVSGTLGYPRLTVSASLYVKICCSFTHMFTQIHMRPHMHCLSQRRTHKKLSMNFAMDEMNVTNREEIMAANYRSLQLLAKRVGIRANTRQDVLRASLLEFFDSAQNVPECEFAEESPEETGPRVHTVCLFVLAFLCLFRFRQSLTNCFTILSWGLVALLAFCAIAALVLAIISLRK